MGFLKIFKMCLSQQSKRSIIQSVIVLLLIVCFVGLLAELFTYETAQLQSSVQNYITNLTIPNRIVFENSLQNSIDSYLIFLTQVLLGFLAVVVISFALLLRKVQLLSADAQAESNKPDEKKPVAESEAQPAAPLQPTLADHQAFLGVVAHELKTPLSAAMAYMESSLRLSAGPSARLLQKARDITDQLIGNLNNLLDSSRLVAGKLTLQPERVSVSALVAEVAQVLALNAERKGLSFYLDVPLFQCDWVCLDPLRMKQILINLLGNAIKFTEVGSVRLSVGQHLSDGDKCELAFNIVDTGMGISTAEVEKLFAAHVQQSNQSHAQYGGFGLGLSICRQLIDLMGGQIELANRCDASGVHARVSIPAKCLHHSAVMPDTTTLADQTLVLLIVGSDEVEREIVASTLGSAYSAVHRFDTLAECLASCEDELSDSSLVLDLVVHASHQTFEGLPRSGVANRCGAQFRRSLGLVRFSDQSRSVRSLLEAGISDYLIKPVTALQILLQWSNTTRSDQQIQADAHIRHVESVLRGKRVLLVEDTDCLRELTASSLQSFGAVVECASNGAEATSLALNPLNRYDFVLMDIHMPFVDGVQAATRIRAHFDSKSLPIFALTAYTQEFELNRCFQAGMNECLAKPIDFLRLTQLIDPNTKPQDDVYAQVNTEQSVVKGVAPLLDIDVARRKFAGRHGLLVKALDLFLRDADFFESELLGETPAPLKLSSLVHKLQGAAGMIGAERLRSLASEIERQNPSPSDEPPWREQLLLVFRMTRQEVVSTLVNPQ